MPFDGGCGGAAAGDGGDAAAVVVDERRRRHWMRCESSTELQYIPGKIP